MVDVSLRLWFFHLTGGGYYPNGIEGVVVILIAVVGCHPKLVVVLPLLVEGVVVSLLYSGCGLSPLSGGCYILTCERSGCEFSIAVMGCHP